MYEIQRLSNSINPLLFSGFVYRMLTLLALMILILGSSSSFALQDNPGSAKNCTSGSVKGIFDKTNYSKLKASFDTNTYQPMNSASASSIPLKIKMSINDINVNTTGNTNTVTGTTANPAIDINRNFKDLTSRSDITLDFQDAENNTSLYLDNVALSVFDIDKDIQRNKTGWDDLISITGITRNNTEIKGVFQKIPTSSVIELANGLQSSSTDASFNCTDPLQTKCQGSVVFSEDIRSVTFSYTNTNKVTAPTTQRFQFRVDSYCYAPQYTFSGIVFNDNGGINQGDASNADITTSNSIYTNNSNYFNGEFNSSAPNAETGIADSTVDLINCTSGKVYGTQLVNAGGATIGQFKISAPITTINDNSNNLCLVEKRSDISNIYPIRTNSDKRTIAFASNIYNYPNNNFGRVAAANAALVLKKYQYINDCPNNLIYSSIDTTLDPRTGFSTNAIDASIIPGKCIAYKITATNRANIAINDFIMKDTLQKKGVNNSKVTSVLADPPRISTDFADIYTKGQNGTLVTKPFTLEKRSERSFHFNTKYGTTIDP